MSWVRSELAVAGLDGPATYTDRRTTVKTQTHHRTHEDMAFTIRVWYSDPADGWFYTIVAEDMDVQITGNRAWANPRIAAAMAECEIVGTF